MEIFKKTTKTKIDEVVNSATSKKIYNKLKNGLCPTDIFESGIDFCCIEDTKKEMDRVFGDVVSIMSDIDNQPATQEELVSLVESDLLDVEALVADIIKYSNWNPEKEPPKTYEDYKATFTNNDLI